MLRNPRKFITRRATNLLNEVLSLNAQEFYENGGTVPAVVVLNEVLSLNAQE